MQFTLLIGGGVVALFYIAAHVPGGFGAIVDAGRHAVKPDGTVYDKFNFLELLKPENLDLIFLLAIWGNNNTTAANGTNQNKDQRQHACNDEKKARWSLIISG